MFELDGKRKEAKAKAAKALAEGRVALAAANSDGRARAYQLAIDAIGAAEAARVEAVFVDLFQLLGDVYFQSEDFETALRAYGDAVASKDGLGNPAVHLRLGKAQFELRNEARAADELCRAYMGGGSEIFSAEPPKYFEFLKTKIQPGPNGW
jgi:hypothetical protein